MVKSCTMKSATLVVKSCTLPMYCTRNQDLWFCSRIRDNLIFLFQLLYFPFQHDIVIKLLWPIIQSNTAENFTALFITLPYWNVNPKTQKMLVWKSKPVPGVRLGWIFNPTFLKSLDRVFINIQEYSNLQV